jgi:hypothetical protein
MVDTNIRLEPLLQQDKAEGEPMGTFYLYTNFDALAKAQKTPVFSFVTY